MALLSTAARRSALMMASRSTTFTSPKVMPVFFSTNTKAKVQEVECLLNNMHWAAEKDNIKEIQEMMKEKQTNRAVHDPDVAFEGQVANNMNELHDMLAAGNCSRDDVKSRVFGLKMMIRDNLYH